MHSLEIANNIKKKLFPEPYNFPLKIEIIYDNKLSIAELESLMRYFNNEKRICDNKLNIAEFESLISHLKSVIKNKDTENQIEHIYYSFEKEYYLAVNSAFIPYTSYNLEEIYNQEDINEINNPDNKTIENYKGITLNIFPENGKTHIIFSFSKHNKKIKEALQKMLQKNINHIKLELSDMILKYCENIAFKPSYIRDYFSENELNTIKKKYHPITQLENPLKFSIFQDNPTLKPKDR
ncbi:hypothetical protein E4T80_00010 [Muribacter muris]|uniref:Uncharacterized protein n=1 Tax=Muribacter muris TaxID=67855 RepID=A0A4Y9K9H1_9PAST|nr:hypothetical protein [Muribacter muris]MBF0783863.1 hypothetical protein [Muribacter muris]MBF0826361.1 hypothetical protein [Muribacter muris]TFV13265.1 hypothetical protein E4T80_00010 [Muribacter muris]